MKKDYKKRIEVSCKNCNVQWLKRFDSIKGWGGSCVSCATKEVANRPENRKRSSEWAKLLIEKFNNHIPNAHHFTSEEVRGEKNNFWKGGITPINQKIRHSIEYKDWRTAVFIRDNYTCIHCGSRGVTLHADHIKPFAYFSELRLVIENGRTLCVPCHEKTPTYKKKKLSISWNIT